MTGPEFAAEVIRATGPDQDPLAEVMAADRRWQERQRRAAAIDEESWAKAKADDRVASRRAMTRIGEALDDESWIAQPEEVPA